MKWNREESSITDSLHCYDNICSIEYPFKKKATDDQFSQEGKVHPAELFVSAVALAHMFAFVELCGKNGFSLTHYEDSAKIYLSQGKAWSLEKIYLYPKTFFEGEACPSFDEIKNCHQQASIVSMYENMLNDKIEVKLR
ncbi:OsmC family protein [Zooshikella marina]|uniref:OsmC family protein n=1 Tax=Zooshikella ganghwensis TaxID=202772 RepID=UPI001BAEDAD5|nr:OsmC family protein [Zooshikella ganghwensis]MBU2709252.1 OsmC family protein [Zooshikella ganghwensis]